MSVHPTLRACAFAILAAGLLSACEQLGIEDPAKIAAAKEAEGKAIGSACRHAARAIEDCYTLNPKAIKAAVYAGWREMDEYMRENKIEAVVPVIPRPGARPDSSRADSGEGAKAEKAADKGDKGGDKVADKPGEDKPAKAKSKASTAH